MREHWCGGVKPEGDTDVRMLSSLNKVYALNANIEVEQFEDLPDQIIDWVSSTDGVNKKHDSLKQFGIVTVSDLVLSNATISSTNGL